MIDVTTTIQEYIEFLKSRNACDPAIPYLEKLITPECVYFKDITLAIDDGKTSYSERWAYWTLMDHGDQMTTAMRASFMKRITNPLSACSIYIDCGWLTDDDDILLFDMFKDKMPNAIKKLNDGSLVRSKGNG